MRVDLFGEWDGILFIRSLSKSRIRAERGVTADDRDRNVHIISFLPLNYIM